MFRTRIALALLVVSLVAAGCGKSNKVGDDSLTNFEDQAQQRLGQTTTTPPTAAVASTTTSVPGKQALGTTTTAPKATTTTTQFVAVEININPDESSSQFDPAIARVFAGSNVRWTNKDKVARQVKGDKNEFLSPSIAPGQSWTWKAVGSGRVNYHDETRPYAVAYIDVVAR